MKYIQKPTVIEAFRFGIDQFPKWFIDAIDSGDVVLHGIPEAYQYCEIDVHDSGTWPTADYGDYVVRYVDGEIYPCKRELFEQCYEEYKNE